MVVVISNGPLVGAVISWMLGPSRAVHAKSPEKDTQKNGFGPQNAMARFGTLLLCLILPFKICLFLISPSPEYKGREGLGWGVGRKFGLQ